MKNLWIYDKVKRKPTPQALVSLYITSSAILAFALFFSIFMLSKHIYGYVPKLLSMLSIFIIIGAPSSFIIWNYAVNTNPKMAIRAYPVYLDSDGELWLFDYNSQAFEQYFDAHVKPGAAKSRTESRFRGSHKEQTIEYCIANNAVMDIIPQPPYDSYAHHIIQVGKITEKGGYLRVQFLCHSKANNKQYSAELAFPTGMDGLDEMRSIFEKKASGEALAVQPREHTEPGVIRIDRIDEERDGCAVVHGIMLKGTIARGDRVTCTCSDGTSLFDCKIAHFYRDKHEIVWATPVEDGIDPGYEIHIKGQSAKDFSIGCHLRAK